MNKFQFIEHLFMIIVGRGLAPAAQFPASIHGGTQGPALRILSIGSPTNRKLRPELLDFISFLKSMFATQS